MLTLLPKAIVLEWVDACNIATHIYLVLLTFYSQSVILENDCFIPSLSAPIVY
jgi:hypothetical protein